MSKMRQRKRLSIAALAFLLVFLAGAAFAFMPGMLDVVGRVGIRDDDYVRWILAATQGPAARPVSDATADAEAPGVNRVGFTHDLASGPRTAAIHGDPSISIGDSDVYLSHAVILDETRGRQSQRIEWSVVFEGPTTARLYVQAMNYNMFSAAQITSADIVDLTSFGPVGANLNAGAGGIGWSAGGPIADDTLPHSLSVSARDLEDMFEVRLGGLPTFPIPLAANDTGLVNNASSTDVFHIELEWTGALPGVAEGNIVRWQWVYDVVTTPGPTYGDIIGGEWEPLGATAERGLTPPDAFGTAGDIFMAVVNDAGQAIPFDDLTPWIGTFVVELDYELA